MHPVSSGDRDVSIPEMIDKDTNTQCGDCDVSTPERIDQDTSTK
jgi:hypothetical protein